MLHLQFSIVACVTLYGIVPNSVISSKDTLQNQVQKLNQYEEKF